MSGEIPKISQEIATFQKSITEFILKSGQTGTYSRLPDTCLRDPTNTVLRAFTYGPNLIANYNNGFYSGATASKAAAAWYALGGALRYYRANPLDLAIRGANSLGAGLTSAAKVLAAGAVGFAGGVLLDRGQEALLGQSYTAAGVKAFLEMPAIWGKAEALPTEVVDTWDKYFSWTNYPDQAITWLKKNLG